MSRIFLFFALIYWGCLVRAGAATQFYMIRHGQTDWNLEKKIQGCADIPLNETGKAQAAELGEKLKNLTFAFCFSSDLQRAAETARIVLSKHCLIDVQFDKRLRQRHFGDWEGGSFAEYVAALGEPGLEPDEAIRERALDCLEELAALHPNSNILIVTHGVVIRTVIAKLCSLQPSDVHVENTAFLKLIVSERGLSVEDMEGIDLYLIDKV
jgi:broad specificity phosphatase PhoE